MEPVLQLAVISDGHMGLFDASLTIASIMRDRAGSREIWWRWTCGLAAGITIARLRIALPC